MALRPAQPNVEKVDKYIDTAYDIVYYVSLYIKELVALSGKIELFTNIESEIHAYYEQYLGLKTSDPTTNNDGNPLTGGEMYLNVNTDEVRVYTGTQWISTTYSGTPSFDTVTLTGGTGSQGQLSWNTDEETLDLIQNGATLQLGQETQYHVRNNTGADILNGTPVMATGTLGASGRITVAPMDGTDIANAKYFLGVATEDIENDTDGKVTNFGKVRGINTTLYGEGAVLWISTTNVGEFTTTEPVTGMRIATAYCINSHNNGSIFVRSHNGHALHESHDVQISNQQDGDILTWNTANSQWENGRMQHTLSDGTDSGELSVQEAFNLEQTKVVYGGNY